MGLEIIGQDDPLTWKRFEELVQKDIEHTKAQKTAALNKAAFSDAIYRGQSNAAWELETSLERFIKEELGNNEETYPATMYYRYLSSIVPAINSLTNHKFRRFKPHAVDIRPLYTMPKYKLLCFARHHGFPTPLLDWSLSYYVAAFFAFRHKAKCSDVAIFAFKEYDGNARTTDASNGFIIQQGPYVETHPRHYRQQSIYTVCHAKMNDDRVFMKHGEAIRINPENHKIKKFILLASERERVLETLFRMNINDYTLFGDDESLMRMLAFKEFRDL